MSHRTPLRPRATLLALASLVLVGISHVEVSAIRAADALDEDRFNPPLRCGFLGIRATPEPRGLRLTEVVSGSPAAEGGLRVRDVIAKFAGKDGFGEGGLDVDALAAHLRTLPAGKRYTVEILRDDERLAIEVEPEAALLRDARDLARRLQNHRYFRSLEGRGEVLARLDEELERAVRENPRTQEAYEALNAVLDRLDVSHLAIIPPWVHRSVFGAGGTRRRRRGGGRDRSPQPVAQPAPHLGVFLERFELDGKPRYFVHSQMNGSNPQKAGLRIGDEVTAINDRPFAGSPRRTLAGYEARHAMYTIQIDARERIRLRFRRRAGDEETEIEVEANEPVGAVRSSRLSVRRLESDRELGYVHLWNVVHNEMTKVFTEAIEGELRPARGLVVDLRGRGGSSAVLVAIAKRLLNDGRPAVLLLDRKSRSAKEVLAFRLKGRKGIRLVGETTAGAVRPATYAILPGGTALMIPVPNAGSVVELTGGVDLEAVGVKPDVVVEHHLPFSAGEDPILARGVEVLRELVDQLPPPKRRRI